MQGEKGTMKKGPGAQGRVEDLQFASDEVWTEVLDSNRSWHHLLLMDFSDDMVS